MKSMGVAIQQARVRICRNLIHDDSHLQVDHQAIGAHDRLTVLPLVLPTREHGWFPQCPGVDLGLPCWWLVVNWLRRCTKPLHLNGEVMLTRVGRRESRCDGLECSLETAQSQLYLVVVLGGAVPSWPRSASAVRSASTFALASSTSSRVLTSLHALAPGRSTEAAAGAAYSSPYLARLSPNSCGKFMCH